MFTRKLFKQNAKIGLRRYYWLGVLVCFVCGILGAGSGGGLTFNYKLSGNNSNGNGGDFGSGSFEDLPNEINGQFSHYAEMFETMAVAFVAVFAVALLFGLAISFFVSGPATVGLNRFFLESREREAEFDYCLFGFKNNYLHVCSTIFVRDLLIYLCGIPSILCYIAALILLSLETPWLGIVAAVLMVAGAALALIPIVMSYKYSMVSYIIAENPTISIKRAMKISAEMTNGHKWDLFVLSLSFIGWGLLAALACGIGFFFLNPYIEATFAEAYTALKVDTINSGKATVEELPGFVVYTAPAAPYG